jgi:DNA repair exonuclease SbcCD ATPase subunit
MEEKGLKRCEDNLVKPGYISHNLREDNIERMLGVSRIIQNMIKIFEKKMLIIKKLSFQKIILKPHIKGLNMNSLLSRLNAKLKFLFRIYKTCQDELFVKSFLKWKYFIQNEKNLNFVKKDLEGVIYKKVENKKNVLKAKIVDFDRLNKEIKTTFENEKDKQSNFNKKIKSFLEKEAIFLNKIKILEDEIKTLTEKVRKIETEINSAKEKNSGLEKYLKDLESSIKILNDQLFEKENDMKNYIQEMNEMLDGFEKIGKFKLTQASTFVVPESSPEKNKLKNTFKITSLPSSFIVKNTSKTTLTNKTLRSSINNSSRNSMSNSVRAFIK